MKCNNGYDRAITATVTKQQLINVRNKILQ